MPPSKTSCRPIGFLLKTFLPFGSKVPKHLPMDCRAHQHEVMRPAIHR